jgi:hypothetical protein
VQRFLSFFSAAIAAAAAAAALTQESFFPFRIFCSIGLLYFLPAGKKSKDNNESEHVCFLARSIIVGVRKRGRKKSLRRPTQEPVTHKRKQRPRLVGKAVRKKVNF